MPTSPLPDKKEVAKDWSVYMVRCADGTFYTGVTNDVEKRVLAHNTLPSGAKYTKARRPVHLAYVEDGLARGAAQSREAKLRKLPRAAKLILIAGVDK